ncbi:MAG TPA: nucleotidyl transferase AbiEii/AbiGii toxin family protein [Puia sp.]|jgi:hypothetical protein|nr:nucleotidyl transferase AbiEii/AbiGii toxin family protein [Puia sp.]
MLYTETVDAKTLVLIKDLMVDEKFKEFNLVGGTSLSLQIGHRKSIDIDLFSSNDFNEQEIKKHLEKNFGATIDRVSKNSIRAEINEIKVDLAVHKYPLLKPLQEVDTIRLISLEDIAAMKLNAITRSGNRPKDFVDIYALLEYKHLQNCIEAYKQKYPNVTENMARQSLNYFNDIDIKALGNDLTLKNFDWKKVTQRMKQAVKAPNKIFDSVSKELKQSLEQKLKQEPKLSNEVKQKKVLKKSQRQDREKGQRPT